MSLLVVDFVWSLNKFWCDFPHKNFVPWNPVNVQISIELDRNAKEKLVFFLGRWIMPAVRSLFNRIVIYLPFVFAPPAPIQVLLVFSPAPFHMEWWMCEWNQKHSWKCVKNIKLLVNAQWKMVENPFDVNYRYNSRSHNQTRLIAAVHISLCTRLHPIKQTHDQTNENSFDVEFLLTVFRLNTLWKFTFHWWEIFGYDKMSVWVCECALGRKSNHSA